MTTLESSKEAVKNWVVLIIDDVPDNLMVALTALKFYGAVVYTANDGEEGLAKVQEISPTVILLDIRMPKIDGWTVFKMLRANPKTANIPVIAITAHAMDGDREEVMVAGFNGYLSKPFNMFTFVDEIHQILSSNPQKDLPFQGESQ